MSQIAVFTVALAAALTQHSQSLAGLIASSNPTTSSGSSTVYSYSLSLTSNSVLQTGDYFTIYDFPGLVPNSTTQPAGFTFSSALVGPTPPNTVVTDSATVANATWTYTAATQLSGPVTLGNFTVESQYNMTSATGSLVSLAQKLQGDSILNVVTQSQVTVPVGYSCGGPTNTGDPTTQGGAVGGPVVPEPTSLALFCLGLPVLGLAYCRRKGLAAS
jgi:hypothetical protein